MSPREEVAKLSNLLSLPWVVTWVAADAGDSPQDGGASDVSSSVSG